MELLTLPKIERKAPHPVGYVKRTSTLPKLNRVNSTSSTDSSLSLGGLSSCSSKSTKVGSGLTRTHQAHDATAKSYFDKTERGGRRSTRSQSIDDQMKHSHLLRLEKLFEEGSKGDAGLDLDQFREAIKKTIGSDLDDEDLEMLFMKVDTNSDGTLDWGEYLSYMLLEFQEKKNMITLDQDRPFPNLMSIKANCHVDSIISIRLLQAYTTRFNLHGLIDPDDGASRFLTVSRDGLLNIWNIDWVLQKSHPLDGSKYGCNTAKGGIIVTDMVCMPNCSTIAVSSTNYEITFYTMMTNMIQKRFQIKDMQHCALSMDYNYNINDPRSAILLWADTSGSIIIIRFYINPNLSLFSAPLCVENKISMIRLLRGRLPGLQVARFPKIHTDWVKQVRYYRNSKGQECIISCCLKRERAVFFADITEKSNEDPQRRPQIIKKSFFAIKKGILCHSFDPEWTLIITGSCDCNVRVWNPYVADKSMVVLKGHSHAVVQVLVRTLDHQVVSIGKDKTIRVWDLRDYTCKQLINAGYNTDLGSSEISAAFFSNRHKELIVATSKIGVFHPRSPTTARYKNQQNLSHLKPVVSVLYNPLFKQIVTGGEDSSVCLWDIRTGTKKMQFFTGSDNEITCMAFDPSCRRLLTGGQNGHTVLWNFNNGEKLHCFERMDDREIVDVTFAKHRIVVTSWNRHVSSYMHSYDDEPAETFEEKHDDDILSLDFHKHDLILATSSYDGDIYLWSLETGCVVMSFNMHQSLVPIQKFHEDDTDKKKSSYLNKKNSVNPADIKRKQHRSFSAYINERRQHKGLKRTDSQIAETFWLPQDMPWLKNPEDNCQTGDLDSVKEEDSSTASNVTNSSFNDSQECLGKTSLKITERATYKVLFLQTRRCAKNIGSLVSAGCEGWICTWSVHQKGGMLGYFKACSSTPAGIFVTSMVTDYENKLLVTGDTFGYIRTWDISEYFNGKSDKTKGGKEKFSTAQPHIVPTSTAPKLLISVRAHLSAITSLAYVDPYGLVASGGLDGSVRLWTDTGRYIGTFGQQEKWDITLPVQIEDIPALMPPDVRRVASLNTLCTSKGVVRSRWDKVRALRTALSAWKKVEKRKTTQEHFYSASSSITKAIMVPRTSIKEQLTTVQKNLLEESSLSTNRQARVRRQSVTVWLQDFPHSIICLPKPIESVEKTFQRLEKDGIQSDILGKFNYKTKIRHRNCTLDSEIRWCHKHALVFCALPFVEIYTPALPQVMRNLVKQQTINPAMAANMTRRLAYALLRSRSSLDGKQKAISLL